MNEMNAKFEYREIMMTTLNDLGPYTRVKESVYYKTLKYAKEKDGNDSICPALHKTF